ncbi:hypothetical protein F2Q69_00018193 [Brassica cretica]|uniref:Uncharacterized protein n=1 Tax=Brassica cretica TaxID=69181 RepID=A0A8S9Q0I3_BRACR|nr:hypothetical protein F2Q69_00018193 [Brassica cretica]
MFFISFFKLRFVLSDGRDGHLGKLDSYFPSGIGFGFNEVPPQLAPECKPGSPSS